MEKHFSDLSTTIAFSIRRVSLPLLLAGCLTSPSLAQVPSSTRGKTQAPAESRVKIVGTPSVDDEDKVTVKIQVKDDKERPVIGLQENNFSLTVDGKEFTGTKNWKSPDKAEPPPTWIIVLLDFSDSMLAVDGSRIRTKKQGAIDAIRKFTTALAERKPDAKVAIVPFGKPGDKCTPEMSNYLNKQPTEKVDVPDPNNENKVIKEEPNKFFLANGSELQNKLKKLEGLNPCASTNIYSTLEKSVQVLANTENSDFHPKDSNKPQPRLSIILLSDGFDTESKSEAEFKSLITLLEEHKDITVHTLGYGLTPERLQKKYDLRRLPTRADVWTKAGKAPPGKVPEEEFVDRDKLAEIAKATGGIAEFSANADAIAEKFKLFLTALLVYEISYIHPNAQRASLHEVAVKVKSPDGSESVSEKKYRLERWRSLPGSTRALIFFSALAALGIGGAVPYSIWAQSMKRQAREN